jgi:acetate CoA/acetoacetate CoA-transferase alpha subunit
MNKRTSAQEAVRHVKDGDTVLIGGFLSNGSPQKLVAALNETGVRNLTVVATDTGTVEMTPYQLIRDGKVSRVMASYIGLNPATQKLMISGEGEVQLFPQGTLAEKIRAGGAGLGGFLTPVGLGTMIEEGKQKIEVNGQTYLLELPIHGNVALIYANVADELGNLFIRGSSKNFNVPMASAADYVVAQVDKIVKPGEIDPEMVTVPGIFVDALVLAGEEP